MPTDVTSGPAVQISRATKTFRATAEVFSHKGEYVQGPISVVIDGIERYTIGVFSLLDDLHSAFVDVRAHAENSGSVNLDAADCEPVVRVQPNGWNAGEVQLVSQAVLAAWRWLRPNDVMRYDVYGYHDILVGAGAGSSSALVQAAILATCREHGVPVSDGQMALLQGSVERGADALTRELPAVVATRLKTDSPVTQLGYRTPRFMAVTWSSGAAVRTDEIVFRYSGDELLLWRVRWASVERAVRRGDDTRLARLATVSALENQERNPSRDLELLQDAVTRFGGIGFSVAHTGSYHTALFPEAAPVESVGAYRKFVQSSTPAGTIVDVFHTAAAAARRGAER